MAKSQTCHASLTKLRETSFLIKEEQVWAIKEEVKIKGKGNSGKRPSLVQRKNEG